MLKRVCSSVAAVIPLLLLSACGGDSSSPAVTTGAAPPAPVAPAATGLTGSVAVGVPVKQGKLRVLDATGAVVVQDVSVGDDGNYSIASLSGSAPWRIEVCGYVGASYECVYSVAQTAGTANVTPLTTATVLLAGSQQPGALMTGAATGLGVAALENAQLQLRTSLGAIMSGNVAASFDFITGSLTAGSRNGYDRVLDAIGVSMGQDNGAFVQITPRLGTGNLYLQPGVTSGSVTADTQANTLPLTQIDALFTRMSSKLVNAAACLGTSGLATELASNARMDGEDGIATGPEDVAAVFCGFFAEADIWGARFMNPTLGRCAFTGADARCRVGFDLQRPDGTVMPVGTGMGVQFQNGAWKFLGSADPVSIKVDARVQRQTRIDNASIAPLYMRAFSIDIARVPGLECAKVTQPVTGGTTREIAILKAFDAHARRLSVWRTGQGTEASLDPSLGNLRNSDDSWLVLPEGALGDEVVRNFFRNGRNVTVSLFDDAACTQPLVVENVSSIEVEIEGVPPVYASLPSFPWPELTADTVATVNGATLAANASATVALAWTYPNGRSGVNGVTFCGSLGECGSQDTGRFGERDVSPATPSVALTIQSRGPALGASRSVALYGSGPDDIFMQTNFTACGGTQQFCQ